MTGFVYNAMGRAQVLKVGFEARLHHSLCVNAKL